MTTPGLAAFRATLSPSPLPPVFSGGRRFPGKTMHPPRSPTATTAVIIFSSVLPVVPTIYKRGRRCQPNRNIIRPPADSSRFEISLLPFRWRKCFFFDWTSLSRVYALLRDSLDTLESGNVSRVLQFKITFLNRCRERERAESIISIC